MIEFSSKWFYSLDNQLRSAGLDSDAQTFDEILESLQNRKIYSPDEFASHCVYVILAGGFSQVTAKKIHKKIMNILFNPPRRDATPLPGGADGAAVGGELVQFSSVGGVPRRGEVGIKKSVINHELPQNKNLLNRAKTLRKAGSLPEALLWREIRGRQINGLDFDRQKVIGNYIADFYCADLGVVIEIDDKSHDIKDVYDERRESYLKSLGLNIIHVSAKDVLKNPGAVADGLRAQLQSAKSNLFGALLEIFNNKNKISAVCKIWENRQKIHDEYYCLTSLDDKLKYLQSLPHIGKITANHLARNLGEDIVKYDIWIQRLGCKFLNKKITINNGKLSDEIKDACDKMFTHLVRETSLPRGYIDVVLWKACQQGLIKP